MAKINARTKTLFKKAANYNWDEGIYGIEKIIDDKDCDKGTAVMVFWLGCPDFFYNGKPENIKEYNRDNFMLLEKLKARLLADHYPAVVSYTIDPMLLPENLGNIPSELAVPVEGLITANEILWPNNNPFQEEIMELIKNCTSVSQMYDLEKQGANFELKIQNGYSYPITVALSFGQTEALRYFIEKGFDLKKKYHKYPLLFYAVRGRSIPTVGMLLDNGVNPNQKGEFGRMAFHDIVTWSNTNKGLNQEVFDYLMSRGADINAKDTDRKTPMDLAVMWKMDTMIEFLKSRTSITE